MLAAYFVSFVQTSKIRFYSSRNKSTKVLLGHRGGLEGQPRKTRSSACRRPDLAQSEAIQEVGLDSGPQFRVEVERMV